MKYRALANLIKSMLLGIWGLGNGGVAVRMAQ